MQRTRRSTPDCYPFHNSCFEREPTQTTEVWEANCRLRSSKFWLYLNRKNLSRWHNSQWNCSKCSTKLMTRSTSWLKFTVLSVKSSTTEPPPSRTSNFTWSMKASSSPISTPRSKSKLSSFQSMTKFKKTFLTIGTFSISGQPTELLLLLKTTL
jgi:hypothetical protein